MNLGVLCSGERAIEELGDACLGCFERPAVNQVVGTAHSLFVGHGGGLMAECL
jgi:hypothetical protein